jgi:hypothetical protein
MIATAPKFPEIAAKLEEIAELVAFRDEFPRPRSKLTIITLAKAIAPLIGKPVERIHGRKKDGAILWFCTFFPQILTMASGSVASLVDRSWIVRENTTASTMNTAPASEHEEALQDVDSVEDISPIHGEFDEQFGSNTSAPDASEQNSRKSEGVSK